MQLLLLWKEIKHMAIENTVHVWQSCQLHTYGVRSNECWSQGLNPGRYWLCPVRYL
jgi:hypothetical protein